MLQTDTLQITPEILRLVAAVVEFKGAWRSLGSLAPDRLTALLRVATIESIGSSTRIEGSRLSDRDVERLLSNLQIQKLGTRDEQEVAGYARVMELVFTSWQDIALTERLPAGARRRSGQDGRRLGRLHEPHCRRYGSRPQTAETRTGCAVYGGSLRLQR